MPVLKFFAGMFRNKTTEKPEVISYKEAMRRKDVLARVTFWKRVMKRRSKKGRAVRKPYRMYRKALSEL